jgi:ABC-type multidrug transport system fused ATPase/permease subunit
MSEDVQLPPRPGTRRILSLARPWLGRLVVSTGFMLIGSGIGLLTPAVAGRVVDAALVDADLHRLNRIVLSLITLFAALGVVNFLELMMLRTAGALMLQDLRSRLYAHLLSLSPSFFERRAIGELVSRMGSDLTQVQGALTQQIPSGVQALLQFVGTLIILLIMQTRLTVLALVVVPPVVLLALAFGRRVERLSQSERDATAEASAVSEEAMSGIHTVAAFDQQDHEVHRYRRRLGDLLAVQVRNARVVGAFSGSVQFAAFTAFAIVLWYGGRLMLQGSMSPGQLTTFLLYTFSIAVSVGTLGSLYAAWRELKGASARIFELLDTPSDILEVPDPTPLGEVRGHLRFESVRFTYPGEECEPAIDDFDLQVEAGEVIGLVGPSGAGKSTIFSLLLRFHDPDQGSLLLDGVDLRDLSLSALRRAIGIVPQEIFLFSGTVRENLQYACPEASEEDLRRAARLAGAHSFIERLPQGYDSDLGQRAVRLSAGQRQRLAIARTFLKDPAILLLDEATSALDPDSEERVQQALSELLRGRTTLVIAHRLVTAQRADRILVLDRGRISSVGRHEELYEKSELYRRYWTLQSLRAAEA